MVSELGFSRTPPPGFSLPDAPRSPLTPSETWGTEVTVSVSTVMLRVDSTGALLFVPLRLVMDLLAMVAAGLVVAVDNDLARESGVLLVGLESRVSPSFTTASSWLVGFRAVLLSTWPWYPFDSSASFRSDPRAGVAGRLLSATVSRANPPALTPRAGVLKEGREPMLSVSSSLDSREERSGGDAVATRFDEIFGGGGSLSAFFRAGIELRPVERDGGGDLSRGEIGQWGECPPDLLTLSVLEPSRTPSTPAGGRDGLFADKARCTAAAEGIEAKEAGNADKRVGLVSRLLFPDRGDWAAGGMDVRARGRLGEPLREGSGLLVVRFKSVGLGASAKSLLRSVLACLPAVD